MENLKKYVVDEFVDLVERVGFESNCIWIDLDDLFSLYYLKVVWVYLNVEFKVKNLILILI